MDKQSLKFTIIVPVYNRPKEIEELFESLVQQTHKNFDVVIVEDGSQLKSDEVVERFKDQLDIQYYFKPNTGPGLSRNYGFEKAAGNYCIFLDSDCILPPGYFEKVYNFFDHKYVDCFGGPDKEHPDFTNLQKAVNYSMTSFFTTGGIRGKNEKLEKFHPRSFNMGFSRDVFNATGGFPSVRFAKAKAAGEDLDLSIQIINAGFSTALIKEAYVYHKRRTSLKQFFRQVFNFGYARITIYKRHPHSLKLLHFLPAVFTLGLIALLVLSIVCAPWFLLPVAFHISLLFADATLKNRNIAIGTLSVLTSYIQLVGYGTGFLYAIWRRIILGKTSFD